jgi:hypothetical protein
VLSFNEEDYLKRPNAYFRATMLQTCPCFISGTGDSEENSRPEKKLLFFFLIITIK